MPKATIQHVTHFVLTLELSSSELDYLRGMMQNPLNGYTPNTEPKVERQIRHAIFEACVKQHT